MAMQEFDIVVVSIGYRKIAMPRDAAMAFFNACAGRDVYTMDSVYRDGVRHPIVRLLDQDAIPTISTIGPAQFHLGLENARMEDERKRREEKEKTA